MTAVATKPPCGLETLAQDDRNAWAEYLEATREQPWERYWEMEPWAWSRLNQRLRATQAKRRAIEDDDGA